jgi:hypothetical protein
VLGTARRGRGRGRGRGDIGPSPEPGAIGPGPHTHPVLKPACTTPAPTPQHTTHHAHPKPQIRFPISGHAASPTMSCAGQRPVVRQALVPGRKPDPGLPGAGSRCATCAAIPPGARPVDAQRLPENASTPTNRGPNQYKAIDESSGRAANRNNGITRGGDGRSERSGGGADG